MFPSCFADRFGCINDHYIMAVGEQCIQCHAEIIIFRNLIYYCIGTLLFDQISPGYIMFNIITMKKCSYCEGTNRDGYQYGRSNDSSFISYSYQFGTFKLLRFR